ncbi:MAG: HAD-IIA family hydrolase [Candidatus Hydrogenedentes bacterium]|nr:HAD-IIA family hydrolase [Candidatus Hydrogenedentota bacterium]
MDYIDRIRCFLIDMDGTIYLGNKVYPGAKEFVDYLIATNRKFLFFTNNPTKDSDQYSKKLNGFGIKAGSDKILTSGMATLEYLRRQTNFKRLFVVAPPSFERELAKAGFILTDDKPEAVVVSFDITLTYEKLRKATYFIRKGLPYIGTNPDLVCPTEEGPIPDCGAIASLLYCATGRYPKYIGKPNPEMIQMALEVLGEDKAVTAMVGDRLYTDMEMAYRSGVTSILVLSGETKLEDLQKVERKPDFVFESVKELLDELRRCDLKVVR